MKCSVGKVNAAACAQILISVFEVDRIINTGVAGSLDADIDIGDIVVSTEAVQHDMDVTVLGFARGEIPYSNQSVFPADEEMRKSAVQAVKETAPDIHVFEGRVDCALKDVVRQEIWEKICCVGTTQGRNRNGANSPLPIFTQKRALRCFSGGYFISYGRSDVSLTKAHLPDFIYR